MTAKLFSGISELNTGQLQVTEKILGSGSYASVHEVYHNGMKYAGKKLHDIFFVFERTQQSDVKYAVKCFAEECRVLNQLGSHPNIVEYKGIYWENGAPAPLLVMECLPVDIDSLMQKCGKLPHEISYRLLHDVASGLKFLHGRETPIVHRDLTARNVLVSTDLHAKIADFGMSTGHIRPSNMTQVPGNFVYMPPESMCANPSYDTSIDIFSFGVLAIYMLSGTLPVPNVSAVQSDASGLKAEHEYSRRWEYLEMIGLYDDRHPSMNLIFSCIDNNPRNRSTAASVLAQMNDIVAAHPVMSMDKWKVIIERLERSEDVRELLSTSLEQQTQLHGHAQAIIEERESDSCSLVVACESSGRQEGTDYSEHNEQKMNIEQQYTSDSEIEVNLLIERCLCEEAVQMSDIILAATSGCSFSLLSGASHLERELKRVLFDKVASRSLSQVISSDFKYHHAYLTLITGQTTILNLVAQLFPTRNCILNMEGGNFLILPYRSLTSERPKATFHQLAVTNMHTCSTPAADLSVTLNGWQVLGWPELSLTQPEFAIPHNVSKQSRLSIGTVDQHKGELYTTKSYVSLITSISQILCFIDFLLDKIQELEDPQARAQFLAVLASHPNTFSSNLAALIKIAVASINREPDAVHCDEVSLWSTKGQLVCKYSYQFSPTLAMQISSSIMGTPVAKLKATDVTPFVCPSATIDKLGMIETHRGGYMVMKHKPTPLKATSSFLQTSVYYYINSNHQYMSFQTVLHLSHVHRLSSLNVVCSDLRLTNIVDVQNLIGKQLMDKAITLNAKINTNDHNVMSQLTVENVNQHVINVENSYSAFPRKLGSHIPPSAHAYGKPDKITGLGSTHKSLKVAVPDSLEAKMVYVGSQNPSETHTTNHEGQMLTSPPFRSIKLFQGHSLKHLMVAYLLTSSTACRAADMKIIRITILANLTLNGLELQELAQFLVHAVKGIQSPDNQLIIAYHLAPSISAIECTSMEKCGAIIITISCEKQMYTQPDQKTKQESRMLSQNGQARALVSQLTTDLTQDAMRNIIVNINNVLCCKSTHIFGFIASDSVAFKSFLNEALHFLNQIIQKPLTTTHLLPLAQQVADKVWERLLSPCTRMYTYNNISLSLQLFVYIATEGMQILLPSVSATTNPFILRCSIDSELSTNGKRKKPKNVTLRQNISHFEQGTRVRTDITRLGNLSSFKIHPWLIIKLRPVDATVYLFLDAYDYHPSNLYYANQDVLYPLQQEEIIVIAGNKQRSMFKNSSTRGIQMIVITTSKQTSLTNASTHTVKVQGSMLNGPLWDGHCSHHVIGTISYHTSEVSHRAREHSVACTHVLWQWPNKYGNRLSHNSPIPAVVRCSLAKCKQSTCKILCCTQAVSNLLNCGLVILSAEVRQALSTIRRISPLSLILDLSAYVAHGEAIHKDKDRVLSYSPQNLPETELNLGDMSCHGKTKSDNFLLPLIDTKMKLLFLQEPPMSEYILIMKHFSAVQERSLDSTTVKQSTALKSLHYLTIRPHQHTAPSNSPPLYTSSNNDHKGTSGGTNGNRSNKESDGRESSSSGREDRDCGERGDKGGEDSCDKSGGGDGGNHGDGGGSDGEGKKPNRNVERNLRSQNKKKRKKRRQRKRRRSTKQSSPSPTEKMKKRKPSHMHKKICHRFRLSLENFIGRAIPVTSFDKTVLNFLPTEESETMILKPSQFPTTVIKPHPQKSPPKSLPLYGRCMYSKRKHRRLGDSVHTHNNADDSNDVGKHGDEKDSDRKEEKLSSQVQKRRRPRHKRRRKRRGRREKGKGRSKRRVRKKRGAQNCYRLNSQLNAIYNNLEDYQSHPYFPPPIMEQNNNNIMIHHQGLYQAWQGEGICMQEVNLLATHNVNAELVIQGQRRRPHLELQRNDSNSVHICTWGTVTVSYHKFSAADIAKSARVPSQFSAADIAKSARVPSQEATSGLPSNAELVTIGRRRRPQLMLPNRPPSQATIVGSACHIRDRQPAIPSCHQISSGAAFMIARVSSISQYSSIQQRVVPACSILSLQNVQNLSFERCQLLLCTRAWDVQGRWLHYNSSRPADISETSPTCSAIAHGRLLIHGAQERHFSSNFNGGISRATTSLVLPARPSFNHSFIPDCRLSACISVAERQCLLHCGALEENLDAPMVSAIYKDLEDYQSDPQFPPPIMEQNVMIHHQGLYQAWQGEGICMQEVAMHANAELVIQGRRRRPHLVLQRNDCTWDTVSNHEEATSGLPSNAELVTIGRRRRPQLMLPNRPPSQATIAGSTSHIHDRRPAIPSSHQISSFVQLNDPYGSFISLTEHNALTTEQIVSAAGATHCDDAEVHTAAVRGPESTTATNAYVGPLAPMELVVYNS